MTDKAQKPTNKKELAGKAQAEATAAAELSLYYQQAKDSYEKLTDQLEKYHEEYGIDEAWLDKSNALLQEYRQLAPFVQLVLENDPQKYSGLTTKDVYDLIDASTGKPATQQAQEIIEEARELSQNYAEAGELLTRMEEEEIPHLTASPTNKINYPMDKVNSTIWRGLIEADPNGQIAMKFDTAAAKNQKRGQAALIYCAINFDELAEAGNITRKLTPFDKRIQMAAAALYDSGNEYTTESQIFRNMGYSGNPSEKQIKKIDESLTKQLSAKLFLNNADEIKTNKGYPLTEYDGSLLPFERCKVYINGQLCEAGIHLFREPPVITFARKRGQVTTVTRELLEAPISKTESNLLLEDYLIERIGHMKHNKKLSRKILLTTLCENCNITTKKQRQRLPNKIKIFLDHYKTQEFITDYIMNQEAIIIKL